MTPSDTTLTKMVYGSGGWEAIADFDILNEKRDIDFASDTSMLSDIMTLNLDVGTNDIAVIPAIL
jgi:hypothetical protein